MEKSGEYVTKTHGWLPMNHYPTLEELKSVDIFKESRKEEFLVGRPFYIDYDTAMLLIADSWKEKVNGIPPGSFLLAFYENEEKVISIHSYIYPVKRNLSETFFIKGADCWGWATWKRGWNLFNPDGKFLLEQLKAKNLNNKKRNDCKIDSSQHSSKYGN